jgi:predicted small lipoprotein YifL
VAAPATAGVLVAAVLAACGQKGPLYLPEKTGEVVTRPAAPEKPAPAETPSPPKREDDETTAPPR